MVIADESWGQMRNATGDVAHCGRHLRQRKGLLRCALMKKWHAWLELARISNLPTVWTNVLAGWLLAGGPWRSDALWWLLAGGSLLYTAGMILNDAMDAKFDREYRKERPIPSGRVSARATWAVSGVMLLAGAAICIFIAEASVGLVLALVAAILLYDAYHKPWAGSVVIMGACRTLLYLVAGSAAKVGWRWETNAGLVISALALGAYIVGVSLVARSEARPQVKGFTGPLGWLCLSVPTLAAAGLCITGGPLWSYVPAIAVSGLVLWQARRILRGGPPKIGKAVGWLLAGIVVVDGLAVAPLEPRISLWFMLCMPLLLLWQRKIAAT